VSIEELDGLEDEVYCFTEPKRHLGVFGGVITGQCGEIPLEEGEPCNLIELYLSRIKNISQFKKLSRLAVRMAIRTTCAPYTNQTTAAVIAANRRTGVGLTGILNATLYNSKDLDAGYKAIQEEAKAYCSQMNIPECIRLTTIKPSGTLGKLGDVLEGCHPAYSRYMIQRIRFGADDELVDKLREAGHKVEPELNQNGTPKRDSMVVEFYIDNGPDAPTADGGFDTWKQLDTLLTLQKHWSDNSVSITVYYQKEDIPAMQQWLKAHLKDIKSISFLLHQGHGFVQAPKEAITKEQYEALVKNVKPIDVSSLRKSETDVVVDNCDDGHCPVK
jgi:ribonucleotide reductase alpha subunit